MDHETAGDPLSGLKWTRRTTVKVAAELCTLGTDICARTVARLLKQMGFSLRVNHKKRAGASHQSRRSIAFFLAFGRSSGTAHCRVKAETCCIRCSRLAWLALRVGGLYPAHPSCCVVDQLERLVDYFDRHCSPCCDFAGIPFSFHFRTSSRSRTAGSALRGQTPVWPFSSPFFAGVQRSPASYTICSPVFNSLVPGHMQVAVP